MESRHWLSSDLIKPEHLRIRNHLSICRAFGQALATSAPIKAIPHRHISSISIKTAGLQPPCQAK
ncbi:hypothetical protein AC578_9687 [Pseudocercospora eumusae]|uniref:Uncharacterized protein n=1 Tax=Pseudocercospora eumusae TaxID=321146 RepID=A0A139HQV4_9PEZI|nr:hypothetical protein AC578_9687 [Pseudocercospora eumusae]